MFRDTARCETEVCDGQGSLERLDDARLATWDTHRPDAFVDMFADDFVIRDTSIAAPITTREGAHDYLRKWIAAFPAMRIRRTSRVVDDESVAGEVEMIGTNTGPIELGPTQVPSAARRLLDRALTSLV
jgi:SnoaL-like domain